ncbi:thymidine kinase [Acholeplasma equirhinis]|uniref:thymidine kinase n=1 Tax=Acholeplasma equirhinis TaxID=555393 RepID=UPI00197AD054|nr:thymidine kinase [Acholeplasma equirhinis]MBN3491098.1 thymidine kinase [Acholeplasma equirhinis]
MYHSYKNGFIEVVCGPMFAGKTEELIRRARRLRYAKQVYQVFKPVIDNRYSTKGEIVSHNLLTENAILIENSSDILEKLLPNVDAVIIDEAQFLDKGIVKIADQLADRGIRVIVGGLDRDFKGEPFGPMPELLAIAEFVTKLTAICVKTGQPATRTQRIIDGHPASYDDPIIVVGASEAYEPRSRHAHEVLNKK